MSWDFETAKYWHRLSSILREQALACPSVDRVAKIHAARLASDRAIEYEQAALRSTAVSGGVTASVASNPSNAALLDSE